MDIVVPLGALVDTPWYPQSQGALGRSKAAVEPFDTFRPGDESRLWFLDFHWPRGLTPLATLWNGDGYAWGTQLAAERMPLPSGRGIAQRMAGTHTYASPIPLPGDRLHGASSRLRAVPPALAGRLSRVMVAAPGRAGRGLGPPPAAGAAGPRPRRAA